MKKRLILYFKRQVLLKKQKDKALSDKYDDLHTIWQKKIDKFENSSRKKQKDAKFREFYEKFFPELRKQREEKERLVQKQRAAIAAATANSSTETNTNQANANGSSSNSINGNNQPVENNSDVNAMEVKYAFF